MSDDTYSTDYVLDLTGWSRSTLTNKIKAKQFPAPAFKEGLHNHYSKASVDAWVIARDKGRKAAIEKANAEAAQ